MRGNNNSLVASSLRGSNNREIVFLSATLDNDQDEEFYEQLEEEMNKKNLFYYIDESDLFVFYKNNLQTKLPLKNEKEFSIRKGLISQHKLKTGEELKLKQEIHYLGFPEDDYETNDGIPVLLKAYIEDELAGQAELLVNEETRVRYLQVFEKHKRKGVGTSLLQTVGTEHGQWHTQGYTEEGQFLIDSLLSKELS